MDKPEPKDDRSDIQQAVEARGDAVDRGEGGDGKSPLEGAGAPGGTAGTGDTGKGQDAAPGAPTGSR